VIQLEERRGELGLAHEELAIARVGREMVVDALQRDLVRDPRARVHARPKHLSHAAAGDEAFELKSVERFHARAQSSESEPLSPSQL